MAKKSYFGVNGVARNVKSWPVGIGNVAREAKSGYFGVGGVARQFFSTAPILNDCDPATIQAVAQAGQAANYWSVGDKIGITLNGKVGAITFSNETYYAFIIGFDHNSSIEGSNTIHFQFGKTISGTNIAFVDAGYDKYYSNNSNSRFIMNTTNSNSGGWKDSYMRNTICQAFLSAMPSAWQNVIAACTKYSDNTGGGNNTASYVTSTSDKIWLLAYYEVFGSHWLENSAEQNYQTQYSYYKNGNSRKKYKHTDTTTACYWWLRSSSTTLRTSFLSAYTSENRGNYSSANSSYGFAPGFMVA